MIDISSSILNIIKDSVKKFSDSDFSDEEIKSIVDECAEHMENNKGDDPLAVFKKVIKSHE